MAKAPKAEINPAEEAYRTDGCAHPREVYDLVGHQQAEQRFAGLFESGNLHHAWLISGPQGIGKSTLAHRMARRVLGGQAVTPGRLDVPATDPVAQRIESLGHGDFLLIRRPYDEKTKKIKSEIPVAETRRVRDFFSRKAAEGGWRVCLIDSMDEMNRSAANALLKTLEEPPDKALIILLSKTPGRLLPTIRSRCMSLDLRAVPAAELSAWLAAHTQADKDDIGVAIKLAGGAPGKALALAQNADLVLRPLRQFVSAFPRGNPRQIHTFSDMLALAKNSAAHDLFWDVLGQTLEAQAIYAATGNWEGAYGPIALAKPPLKWADLSRELAQWRSAQDGLNMNKKTVLLHGLERIGAG